MANKHPTRNRSTQQSRPTLTTGLERKANAVRTLFQLDLRKAVDESLARGEEFFNVRRLREPQYWHDVKLRLSRIVISTSGLQDVLDRRFGELLKLRGDAEQARSLLRLWIDEVFESCRKELVQRLVDSQDTGAPDIFLYRGLGGWVDHLQDVRTAAGQFVGTLLDIFKTKLHDRLDELVETEILNDLEPEPVGASGSAAGLVTTATTGTESANEAAPLIEPEQPPKGRHADVESFKRKIMAAEGYKLTNTDIRIVVGRSKDPRSLEYFQYNIAEASKPAIEDYDAVLEMEPAEFMSKLRHLKPESKSKRKSRR